MSGKIPEPFIQEILARVDLVDLIGARIPLRRSGANYMGRCPFHSEKTPSFSVNRQKQFYYCFGCGAHGSAIGFLMQYDRLSFPEAVETLAESLGLPVPREAATESGRRIPEQTLQSLHEMLERASRFFQRQLRTHPDARRAVDYLRARGVSGEIALRYGLGYAPPGRRNLPEDWPVDILTAAGLLAVRESGLPHDWFRDRIQFPIRDRRGRVAGFGGRLIGEGQPKYLNSPETDAFHKHREVYGLFELLESVRQPESIVVVEGYLDVIALAQHGIANAVATLGTATSTDQIGLLFRHTATLTFCFDGDPAGRSAAWKALEAGLPHLRDGRQLRFLTLPEGEDPDALVRAEGGDAFLRRLGTARPFSDFFFERLAHSLDLGTIEGRAALVNRARPLIERLPAGVFREMIAQRLGELTRHHQAGPGRPVPGRATRAASVRPSALRTLLALLLQYPALIEHVDAEAAESLRRIEGQGAFIGSLLAFLNEHPRGAPAGLLEAFRDRPEAGLIGKLIAWDTQVAEDQVLTTFLDHLRHFTEDRAREARLDALIEKARRQELSREECEELKRLTHAAG